MLSVFIVVILWWSDVKHPLLQQKDEQSDPVYHRFNKIDDIPEFHIFFPLVILNQGLLYSWNGSHSFERDGLGSHRLVHPNAFACSFFAVRTSNVVR
mmetsp:Transcript_20991/g.44291  ORF Transcript_20991/g.44291 Transcript_20991/m.44291 type:complete len:97 (-) Transcript_20991:1161-1451(-)